MVLEVSLIVLPFIVFSSKVTCCQNPRRATHVRSCRISTNSLHRDHASDVDWTDIQYSTMAERIKEVTRKPCIEHRKRLNGNEEQLNTI